MQVLITFDTQADRNRERLNMNRNEDIATAYLSGFAFDLKTSREPVAVRFSGHPEALLAMFRTLHIE